MIANADLEIIDRPIDGIKDWGIPSIEFLSIATVDYFIKRMYDFVIGINIARVGSIEIAWFS
ncbi:hypothetical protein [Caldanaerobius polysaccharolyticus]|uniref:hypothetical protein n=1 Tax=Caldanaerobius polysaccharolyticus TaxID=44256 RepID=UPI00047A0CD7|nr:hypothetical protein [Caldanaerobius polysaccharolyticus]